MKQALLACARPDAARRIDGILQSIPLFSHVRAVPDVRSAEAALRESDYHLLMIPAEEPVAAELAVLARARGTRIIELIDAGEVGGELSRHSLPLDADAELVELTVRAAMRDLVLIACGNAEESNTLGLSKDDVTILHCIAQGLSNPQIATRLFYSENTIKYKISTMLAKFGADDRVQLAVRAVRCGII